jgi:hypothetical protein
MTSFAQDSHEVVFVFNSKEEVKQILNTSGQKILDFQIQGIESDEQANKLIADFLSFYGKVKEFTIAAPGRSQVRDAHIVLAEDVTTAYFTKILISFGIRKVMVDKKTINTETLND